VPSGDLILESQARPALLERLSSRCDRPRLKMRQVSGVQGAQPLDGEPEGCPPNKSPSVEAQQPRAIARRMGSRGAGWEAAKNAFG
jgi:hypothetical protein